MSTASSSKPTADLTAIRDRWSQGALEAWVCQRDGRMTFYHHTAYDHTVAATPAAASSLCPPFPTRIDA